MRAPSRLLPLAALATLSGACDVIAQTPLFGIECSKVDHVALTLRGLQTGAEIHVERFGTLPDSVGALYERGILRGTQAPDAWDHPFALERPGPGRVRFRSAGPDGLRDTADDLLSGEIALPKAPEPPLSCPSTPAASPPR